MSRTIRIDDEVFAELQRLAVGYGMQFETPNNVLRLVLSIPAKPASAADVRRQLNEEQREANRDCGDAAEWDSDGVRS